VSNPGVGAVVDKHGVYIKPTDYSPACLDSAGRRRGRLRRLQRRCAQHTQRI